MFFGVLGGLFKASPHQPTLPHLNGGLRPQCFGRRLAGAPNQQTFECKKVSQWISNYLNLPLPKNHYIYIYIIYIGFFLTPLNYGVSGWFNHQPRPPKTICLNSWTVHTGPTKYEHTNQWAHVPCFLLRPKDALIHSMEKNGKKMAPPLASSLQRDELATTPAELPWCCDTIGLIGHMAEISTGHIETKDCLSPGFPDILGAALQAVEGFQQGRQDLLGPSQPTNVHFVAANVLRCFKRKQHKWPGFRHEALTAYVYAYLLYSMHI